jgi:glycosyltransferase involved in cell wall biosynthesis
VKLQRVLTDETRVNAYRQRAQARVREHYDWETIVDRYESLFATMGGHPISSKSTIRETTPEDTNK